MPVLDPYVPVGVFEYECAVCLSRVRAEHLPGECGVCGGLMQDISVARE
jgi:hypothetical protein